ncbi:transaldolase family protein [Chromobacterium sphagni]|uniref:transaldolase family protein n=1 Tax=Chromobacterium sphagni TaxID=1903179 RepID=UPI00130117EC
MLRQARALAAISPRMVVKIPAINDGFKAISILEKEGVATLRRPSSKPGRSCWRLWRARATPPLTSTG